MLGSRARSRRSAGSGTVGVGISEVAAVVVAVVVAAGLLASCQSNPAPSPAEGLESSASPSVSASPTPTPPAMPAEAEGTSRASAKAFVRHYISLINFAMATGDVTALENLSSDRCSTCAAVRERIIAVHADDEGRVEGGGWTIASQDALPTGAANEVLISTAIRMAEQTVYSSSQPPQTSRQSRGHLDFRLQKKNATWEVARLEATR
jgi:hypothetical protein